MARIDLQTPFFEEGIQNVNFFNGRILTGLAMQEAQTANRQQHQQLGQAIGAGVVKGLTVSLVSSGASNTTPIVKVEAGLAINAEGQALELPTYVEINLILPKDISAQEAGLFAACSPTTSDDIYTGEGPYLLVIAPASELQGSAPMHGLNGNGRADSCGFAYAVEGVQFKLIYVDLDDPTLVPDDISPAVDAVKNNSDPASQSKLRNLLAHLCLGTTAPHAFSRDLFSQFVQSPASVSYSLLDKLRDQTRLSACEVPLALVYWTASGIQFVDMGAVRRRVTRQAPSMHWPPIISDQRLAEGEAAFLQFQEQVAYLTRSNVPQSEVAAIQAINYFRFLPAAGILPVIGGSSSSGFTRQTFFTNVITLGPTVTVGDVVSWLFRTAAAYPPVDIETVDSLRLYYVRENYQGAVQGQASPSQRYLLFASPYLPLVPGNPILVGPTPPTPPVPGRGTGGFDVDFADNLGNLDIGVLPAQPVTAVKGIGPQRAQALAGQNIRTLDDLANASLSEVMTATGLGQTAAGNFIATAKNLLGSV